MAHRQSDGRVFKGLAATGSAAGFSRSPYQPGLQNAASYMASGHPFLSGGAVPAGEEVKINFPYVTKKITITQMTSTGSLRVHFRSRANNDVYAGHHYVTLQSFEDSISFDWKCTKVFISNPPSSQANMWQSDATVHEAANTATGFEIQAELTNIPRESMFELTGSGVTERTHAGFHGNAGTDHSDVNP